MLSLVAMLFWAAADPAYVREVQHWRTEREAKLKMPDGWLSLAGLFWLKEGANLTGSQSGLSVELPPGTPAVAGTFHREGNRVAWQPVSGSKRSVRTDKSNLPDVIQVGRVKLSLIERGSKVGVRVRDPESRFLQEFSGLDWFAVDPSWRVRARFISQPRRIRFDAQAGDPQVMESPGYAEWTHSGRKLRLTPVSEGTQLFWIFRDKSAGTSTYPAARFLYTDLPRDGFVTIDFNKAYNPPCVFTPYATCPLPPPENRLPVEVRAGEKMYGGH